MKMEIDLETMLDIALGGPEIGPLNLQVLHGIMREVFQRIDLSNQNIVVEKESPEFCNSFNFIKCKMDEKNKRPRTAGGTHQKLKSNVSIIVSDYVRVPIGDSKANLPSVPANDVEDRLRYIESELKNVKDFPTIEEMRNWAKEKANPDTVVTDLWHFVSLNHRVNGIEEGIQKLTTLIDQFIPELKKLGEEQNVANGRLDDTYSQFKGLSERMTYIDSKVDNKVDNVNKNIKDEIKSVVNLMKHMENKLIDHPKFKDLDKLVTLDVFNEAQDMARKTVKDIQEQLSSKLNYSILEQMVSKDDFKSFMDILNSVDSKVTDFDTSLIDFVKISDLDKYVTNASYNEVHENMKNMTKQMDIMNVSLEGKADKSTMENMVKNDIDKLSNRVEYLARMANQQNAMSDQLKDMEEQLKKKANNDDVIDVLKKEDMKKTFNKIQNHQCIINDIQNWQKSFDREEVYSKVNDLVVQTSEMKETLSNVNDELMKNPSRNVSELANSVKELVEHFNEHDKTCKSNFSGILNNIELKIDKTEIQALKDYLESCYNTLAQQYQDSLNDVPCCHPLHQPKPPKSQGMPYISQSTSINISKKTADDHCCNQDAFLQPKSDVAAVRSQMKFNCLSCSQPLAPASHSQFHTVRGKALSAHELDHLKMLQKMLKPDHVDTDIRACGGRHTSSVPYIKKTGRTSAKGLPAMAFASQDGVLIDGEVDIEGLDGKLYRGLISRKDFISQTRCKSANELRTVSPRPGSGKERPISGKCSDFRNYGHISAM